MNRFLSVILFLFHLVSAISNARISNRSTLIAEMQINSKDVQNKAPDWILNNQPNGDVASFQNAAGGPILTGVIPVIVIYYGDNFAVGGSQQMYIYHLNNVLARFGTSQWYNSAKDYASGIGQLAYSISISVQVNPYKGSSLDDTAIQAIINNIFPNKTPNAIYLVVTDSTVSETFGQTKYGQDFCGYHSNYGSTLYAFIGTGSDNCVPPPISTSDGGKLSAAQGGYVDGFISVLLHELIETVTDPFGNAWLDSEGNENGDICAWVFGAANNVPGESGLIYNLEAGGAYYLVQQNLDFKKKACFSDINIF